MDAFLALYALVLPALPGYVLLALLLRGRVKTGWWERFFLSLALGYLLLTQGMFLFSLAGIRFTGFLVGFAFILPLLTVLAYRYLPERASRVPARAVCGSGALVLALTAACLGVVATIFLRTFHVECDIWDSWANWAFKAKIYFLHQRIPFEKFPDFTTAWGCWDYPHQVPLLEAWIMTLLRYWNDQWPRLIFPLCYAGAGVSAYSFLRRYVARPWSMAGVLMILTYPMLQAVTMGTIAEPVLYLFYFPSVFYLIRWVEGRSREAFLLSAVLAAGAAWTKNEGAAYLLIDLIVISYAVGGRGRWREVPAVLGEYLLPALILAGPWWVVKTGMGLRSWTFPSEMMNVQHILGNGLRLPEFIAALGSVMMGFVLPWLMVIFFLRLRRRKPGIGERCLALIIAGHFLLAAAVFLVNPGEVVFLNNLMRLMTPPAIFCLVHVLMGLEQPPRLSA